MANAAKKNSAGTYSKEQLLKSKRYQNRRDLLGALLKKEKRYTYKETDAAIANYEKREVK